MKVLIVGDMRPGSNSRSVADGYVSSGNDVRWVDTSPSVRPKRGSSLWLSIHKNRSVTKTENDRVRSMVTKEIDSFAPDMLLAIKTVLYDQSIFLDNRTPYRVHLSFDDVSNPDNISPNYLQFESHWDLVLTTKQHNISELARRGVRESLFIWGAYDPYYRKRTVAFREREFGFGFIGAARPDRLDLPKQFARHIPGEGVIYGPRWRRSHPLGRKGVVLRPSATARRYTEAANSIKVGLILLNSENRDTHTNRSLETPATGQMVLAQRTWEHEELFEENKEAIFFEDFDEMWSKIDWLAKHPESAEAIAEAGYQRITCEPNTYADRARQVVQHLGNT